MTRTWITLLLIGTLGVFGGLGCTSDSGTTPATGNPSGTVRETGSSPAVPNPMVLVTPRLYR